MRRALPRRRSAIFLAPAQRCVTSPFMSTAFDRPSAAAPIPGTPLITHARFRIGDIVRHRHHGFRGVVFDVDPVFANSEEWYESIPEHLRPARAQPFYHLF